MFRRKTLEVGPWWIHCKYTQPQCHRSPLSAPDAFPAFTEYISMRLYCCVWAIIITSDFFFPESGTIEWGVGDNVSRTPHGISLTFRVENECSDWQVDHMYTDLHSRRELLIHFFVPASFFSLTTFISYKKNQKKICVPACWHQSRRAWHVLGCSPAYWTAWHLWRQTALWNRNVSTLQLVSINSAPALCLTHLCEVSLGSTDMSDLWLPRNRGKIHINNLSFLVIVRVNETQWKINVYIKTLTCI